MPLESKINFQSISIDVEEYFQIETVYNTIGPDKWDAWPSRVEYQIDLLLELFNKHHLKGTFFTLGSVARKHPKMIKKISETGHEIASHGTMHDRLHRLGKEGFREDLSASKKILEDICGQEVIGYRAPTFSVMPETAWAVDILHECGFKYDSSIFPVVHDRYGVPEAPDRPYYAVGESGSKILEVPPLTWRVGNRKLAVAGGGYFRMLPLILMKMGLRQAKKEGRPSILYFHPWEFDADIPKMPLKFLSKLRTYLGLSKSLKKLDSIISDGGDWIPINQRLSELNEAAMELPPFKLKQS